MLRQMASPAAHPALQREGCAPPRRKPQGPWRACCRGSSLGAGTARACGAWPARVQRVIIAHYTAHYPVTPAFDRP